MVDNGVEKCPDLAAQIQAWELAQEVQEHVLGDVQGVFPASAGSEGLTIDPVSMA